MALTREQVVRTALDLLDETGLDGLTLRVLADRLGVKAPALYWHVASKSMLLDEMATTMLRDLLENNGSPSDDWPTMMAVAADGLRSMMLSRRDGARVFAGTYLTDDSLVAATEGPLRVLTSAGFALPDAVLAWNTLYCYVVGFAIEEQATRTAAGEPDPRFDPAARRQRLDPRATPLASRASEVMFADADARFEFGVQAIVAGVRSRAGR